jgi:enoyl-CoA hydratase/carnithine racemase
VHWELDVATKIGTITLNSPETFNALTVEMGRDFSSLCRDLEHDLTTGGKECHAIVLTGAGNKAVSLTKMYLDGSVQVYISLSYT